MTDLIKRDDALAAIDMALNNATGDLFDVHEAIRALPAVASATLTPNPVDDSKTADPVVNDPAAIPALQARIEELVKERDGYLAERNKFQLYLQRTHADLELEVAAVDALNAKLAKAVEALRDIAQLSFRDPHEGWRGVAVKRNERARAALAELEGE